MSVIRYKGGFDYKRGRTTVIAREFAKETDSRLFHTPEYVSSGGAKWTNKTDWPYTSFEEAREAEIQWRINQIASLEKQVQEYRTAIEELRAAENTAATV